jgi:LacI family transcriptional regulator
MIGDGIMTDEVGYRFTERFLAMKPRPTAILVSSMMMALGAFRAMRAAGLELGRDVSMIAHDDVFPFLNADRMVPAMSTTRSSIRAAGTRVAELVIELLRGRRADTIHELWPVDLIIRGSSGPPRS